MVSSFEPAAGAATRDKRRGIRAFTLIELLVVISIIALLIAMMMPTLRLAREQGKLAVCSANLHGISRAMQSYQLEGERFPLVPTINRSKLASWCSFGYGGDTGVNVEMWKNWFGGMYHLPTPVRPLSVYILGKKIPSAETRMPVFRCPSDGVTGELAFTPAYVGQHDGLSAYQDVGTSYQMNMSWVGQAMRRLPGLPYSNSIDAMADLMDVGSTVWKKYQQRDAARFVTLVEDPFDFAIFQRTSGQQRGIQVPGFHKKFSIHNAAFLDGHVAYKYFDTRFQRGFDWTVTDEDWDDTRRAGR